MLYTFHRDIFNHMKCVHIYIYYRQGKESIHMDIFRKLRQTLALLCAGSLILGAGYNLTEQLTLHASEQGVSAEVQKAEQLQGDQRDG